MTQRMFSPSTARNREPILAVWRAHMPTQGSVLEIASGSGEHAVFMARALPELTWRPGDPDPDARASIAAWIAHEGLLNVAAPHAIDAADPGWPAAAPAGLDAIVSINMIHIAPFAAARGLVSGAAELLGEGGRLFLYGPFARNGAHTARSNAAFDESLKARNPAWGVRDLDREIAPLADAAGFDLGAVVEMPANNLSVVFVRR